MATACLLEKFTKRVSLVPELKVAYTFSVDGPPDGPTPLLRQTFTLSDSFFAYTLNKFQVAVQVETDWTLTVKLFASTEDYDLPLLDEVRIFLSPKKEIPINENGLPMTKVSETRHPKPASASGKNGTAANYLLSGLPWSKKSDWDLPHDLTIWIYAYNPAKGFSKYFLSKTISDVEVQVGGKSLPAHRFVLIEQSSVFAKMFEEMKESRERVLNMEEFDADVVQEFLEFLYTGKCKSLGDGKGKTGSLTQLLHLAHMYDVGRLLSKCEAELKEMLDIENVESILNLSKLFGAVNLLSAAQSFYDGNSKVILDSRVTGDTVEKTRVQDPASD